MSRRQPTWTSAYGWHSYVVDLVVTLRPYQAIHIYLRAPSPWLQVIGLVDRLAMKSFMRRHHSIARSAFNILVKKQQADRPASSRLFTIPDGKIHTVPDFFRMKKRLRFNVRSWTISHPCGLIFDLTAATVYRCTTRCHQRKPSQQQ